MEANVFKKNVERMQRHSSVLTAFSFIVLLSNLMLTLLAFNKKERTIVVPATVEKEFWIEGNRYSPSYLEQFGIFLAQLLLNKSPASVSLQNKILLEHVSPGSYPTFKKALEDEMREMQAKDLTYLFFPKNVRVNPKEKSVHFEGERVTFLGTEKLLTEMQKYILHLDAKKGALLLKGIKKEEVEK